MNALLLLSVLAQFPADVFEGGGRFNQVEQRDGVTVSQRAVKGSPFFEYRIEVKSENTAEQLCDAIFEWGTHDGEGPGITKHEIIEDGDDVRVVYQQIAQPVVARRDFALTVARTTLEEGKCRIRFRATNDRAPPLPEGFVRLDRVWGEWLAEPLEGGGAKLTHRLFSDPAGSVPPFLVHGAARKSARDAVLSALEKTKRFARKGAAK